MAEEHPKTPPSFGNMSEHHWSRARRDQNQEALDYYRERSRAPGVAEGGGERNFYCMECAGVIPHEPPASTCPHCGVAIEGTVRRYFNWVEMSEPARSDAASLWPTLSILAVALLCAAFFLVRWLIS